MEYERLIQRFTKKKDFLQSKRPLSPVILNRLQHTFMYENTYNSNAIEGNTLTLQETQLVLQEGMTIRGKPLREHFEVKNHAQAIYFVEQLVTEKKPMDEKSLLQLHEYILDNIDQQWAGRYRNAQVRIAGSRHVPPNAQAVPTAMVELISVVQAGNSAMSPVEFAADVHHQFVHIHPFFDGNGRTGRLLMNFILMQAGYPPATILKNDRFKYYTALEQAHHGNKNKLHLLVGQAVERSLDLYIEAIESTTEANQYRPLAELALATGKSQEYLSLLARQGKLDAFKQSRNWYSSLRAVDEYMSSRKRKRN